MEKLSVVDPKYPIDYSKGTVPPTYVCGKCEATGVKLWREYQTPLSRQSLLCMDCACKAEGEVYVPTEDGRSLYTGEAYHWHQTAGMNLDEGYRYDPRNGAPPDAIRTWVDPIRTRQIGWHIPAIPTEDNKSFWGCTFAPQKGLDWWCRLPTLPHSS